MKYSEVARLAREEKVYLDRPRGDLLIGPPGLFVYLTWRHLTVQYKEYPLTPVAVMAAFGRWRHYNTFGPHGLEVFMRRVKKADPFAIRPPHGANGECVDSIMKSMEKNGWSGRPLLVSGTRSFTGSHRIEAARRLGLAVDIINLTRDETQMIRQPNAVTRLIEVGYLSLLHVLSKDMHAGICVTGTCRHS